MATVIDALLTAQARSVLDLGCGEGELMVRLTALTQFSRIVGIDISAPALQTARHVLGLDLFASPHRIQLAQASFTDVDAKKPQCNEPRAPPRAAATKPGCTT